ncbi:MAG: hypothetical protein E7326_05020 [Clostridiales bacterium]|nr:hypothetical protein [Clostridiales bacterium]
MFVSNIPLSFSCNLHTLLQKGEARTFRALVRPTWPGTFSWRFGYQNAVDSTWDDGSVSFANLPGGHFRIRWAEAAACDGDETVAERHFVTFCGTQSADVSPGALIASDPVPLSVAPGGYVTFTWCLEALEDNCVLPGTPDSMALCDVSEGDVHHGAPLRRVTDDTYDCCTLPCFWQADRDAPCTFAFIGDSITQGCQTRTDMQEQWAARIIKGLPCDIAGLNVGLGYARAQDAATGGAWLQKLSGADIVNVCLGVNDIFQMRDTEDHAAVLIRNLTAVVRLIKQHAPRTRVVLCTVPPFSMQGDEERVRKQVNACIREDHLGADAIFDMELLAVPGTEGLARFGDHPDGIGGAVVAGEYLSHFLPDHRHILFPQL